jgi:tetratricopeptide (TPR) repeat protein
MLYLGHVALLFITALVQDSSILDRSEIEIINNGKYIPINQLTNIQAGPAVGNMLNAHYFPGINLYNGGRYKEADAEFTYVITRPHYLIENPRRAEFLSTSYYLRGMIYAYHAKGLGRQSIAQEDFEAALKWNPRNYVVFLELSRLYASLGFPEEAASVLRHLLDLKPDDEMARQARMDLDAITQKADGPTSKQ